MSISLYRKYRPQDFQSVVGQDAAVEILRNSISKSRVGHAYLFSGPRGCGKTSAARIFAKALNCLEPVNLEPCGKCKNCLATTAGENLDVIEIDGASNNTVDEIRELKTHVSLAPFNSKYKIYIIDEVHMLSISAFNALLKTLEEPPDYVIFILSTTEPQKVPVTIRSRCQHIPFSRISTEDIFARLSYVCKAENINANAEALWEISRQADGALRDALSILEQVAASSQSSSEITIETVENALGAGSRHAFENWLQVSREDFAKSYTVLKAIFDSGTSPVRIFEEIFVSIRNLWLVRKYPQIIYSLGLSDSEEEFLKEECLHWEIQRLHDMLLATVKILAQARSGVRGDVLLGLFALEIDPDNAKIPEPIPASRMQAPVSTPKPMPIQPQIPVSKPKPKPEPEIIPNIPNDDALKDECLRIARENNFMIFCGILHADFYTRDGNLCVRFADDYAFRTLQLSNNPAKIHAMLHEKASSGEVLLEHSGEFFTCPKFTTQSQTLIKPAPEIITQISPEPLGTQNSKPKTVFEKFLSDLQRLPVQNEIILRRKNTPDEIPDQEQDQEQNQEPESDNEDND